MVKNEMLVAFNQNDTMRLKTVAQLKKFYLHKEKALTLHSPVLEDVSNRRSGHKRKLLETDTVCVQPTKLTKTSNHKVDYRSQLPVFPKPLC